MVCSKRSINFRKKMRVTLLLSRDCIKPYIWNRASPVATSRSFFLSFDPLDPQAIRSQVHYDSFSEGLWWDPERSPVQDCLTSAWTIAASPTAVTSRPPQLYSSCEQPYHLIWEFRHSSRSTQMASMPPTHLACFAL